MNCPLCKNDRIQLINKFNFGTTATSCLYDDVIVYTCNNCGHIFNFLSEEDQLKLEIYYSEESVENKGGISAHSDLPGSCNTFSIKRYEYLYEFISSYITFNTKILDVGCARGGFLYFLYEKGFENIYGVDISTNYIENNMIENVKLANADNLPFSDNSFDLVILDQVLEHLVNPRKAVEEAMRVLKEGGIIVVGVPDANNYNTHYIFDFYWFLLKDHIQHFDFVHLKKLFNDLGFVLIDSKRISLSMMSETMKLPNLMVSFEKSRIKEYENASLFNLKDNIINYIEEENIRFNRRATMIEKLMNTKRPIFIWGLGREFLFLWNNTNLKKCNIKGLIDQSYYKQNSYVFDDFKINGSDILRSADHNSVLLITALAHKNSIREEAVNLDFMGEIIEL